MRSIRNQPFCWQEKAILRFLRVKYNNNTLSKLRCLYGAITEIDSDFNGKDIKYYTKTISTYSGLSVDWIPKGLKILEKYNVIIIHENRESGKYMGNTIEFTPDKFKEIYGDFTVRVKSGNGKTVNGKSATLEHSILLEHNINKELTDFDKSVDPLFNNKFDFKKISEIKEIGGFTTKINPSNPSKTLLKALNFIIDYESKNTFKKYIFDELWIKKNNIPNELSFKYKDFIKSIKRFNKMKIEGYWPNDKRPLPKNIMDFFYNPRTKKSWFLYCLYNRPKELNEINKSKLNFPNEFKNILSESFLNNSVILKKSIELKNWYNENSELLRIFHTYEKGNWSKVCGNIEKFLFTYKEFFDSWEKWNIGNYGINNNTWKKFIVWLEKKYKIKIDVSKRKLEKTKQAYERELKR